MIVQRVSVIVKPGCMDKIVGLVKAEVAISSIPHKFRLYTPNLGKIDVLCLEYEFENLAEQEQFWAGWRAKPSTAEFWPKWSELRQSGGCEEILNLVEV